MDSRIGLFSRANRPSNPLAIVNKSDAKQEDAGAARAHVPHRVWLKFLEDRFAVVRHNNMSQLGIFFVG